MTKNIDDIIKLLKIIGFSHQQEFFNSKDEKVVYYTYKNLIFIFQGICTMLHYENKNCFEFHYENDYNITYKELYEFFKTDIRKNKICNILNKNREV